MVKRTSGEHRNRQGKGLSLSHVRHEINSWYQIHKLATRYSGNGLSAGSGHFFGHHMYRSASSIQHSILDELREIDLGNLP
jgi:hypothetical protein